MSAPESNFNSGPQQEPKEMLWPSNGYVFEQEFMLPAYCKPKVCPLKSVTLEKLEKMQIEAQQRLKELERIDREEEEKERQKQQNTEENEKEQNGTEKRSASVGADIWRADEDEQQQQF